MDAVCAANPITLPEGLVVEELDSTLEALRKKAEQDNTAFDETRLRTVYRPLMARRVQLALILGQAVDIYDIQLRDEQVEAKLAEVVSAYSNAEEVAHWYKTNEEAYQSVERMAHEEEVVRYILGKARVREVIMTPRDTAPTAAVA
jgi:trigger factor